MLPRAAGYTLQLGGALGVGALGTAFADSIRLDEFNIEKVKWDRVALVTATSLLALKSGRSIVSKAKFNNLNVPVVIQSSAPKMDKMPQENEYLQFQALILGMAKKEQPQVSLAPHKIAMVKARSKSKTHRNDGSDLISRLRDTARDYEKQIKTDHAAAGTKADKLSKLYALDTSLEDNNVTDVSGENPFIDAAEEMEANKTLYTTRQQRNAEQIKEDDQVIDDNGYNRAFCRQLPGYEIA